MKSIIFLVTGVLMACSGYPQKNSDVVSIEFASLSRGGYSKQLLFTSDSVILTFSEGRGATAQTLKHINNPKDWTLLLSTLKEISLAEIADLPSPTMKRAFDGARHSTITVITKNGTSAVHSFDDEDPHQKLQALMKVIKQLSE